MQGGRSCVLSHLCRLHHEEMQRKVCGNNLKKSSDGSFLSALFLRLLLVRIARRREKRLQKKPAYKGALELTGLCIYMLKDAYEETTEKVLLYGLIRSLYRSQ
jgi:hypothetical protein